MADWDVVIEGDEAILATLSRAEDLAAAVDPALERGAVAMQGDLAHYPAAPTSSTYRRTGTLGRRWVIGRGQMYRRLSNNTDYVGLVQDRDEQATAHRRTGWPTWQGVVERRMEEIARDVDEAVGRVLS